MKCHVKRQSPSKPDNKVHQTSGAHQRFSDDSDEADDSISIVERVGLVSSNVTRSSFMVPFTFHTEYSARALQLQLSWILERRAVQCLIKIC